MVIGAARPPGIGRAAAARFADAGDDVVCVDCIEQDAAPGGGVDLTPPSRPVDTSRVSRSTFDRTVAEIAAAATGSVTGRACTDAADWSAAIEEVATAGRLDICCVLGGVTGALAGDGPLLTLPDDSFGACLQINLIDSFRAARTAATAMIRLGRPGVIVVLSSHAARTHTPGAGALGAARLALEHLINGLAAEVGQHGIRCVTVSPLAVSPTPQFPNPALEELAARQGMTLDDWLSRTIPLGRPQQADETAAVIEFLCSPQASFISGITVPVHGAAR